MFMSCNTAAQVQAIGYSDLRNQKLLYVESFETTRCKVSIACAPTCHHKPHDATLVQP